MICNIALELDEFLENVTIYYLKVFVKIDNSLTVQETRLQDHAADLEMCLIQLQVHPTNNWLLGLL